MSFDVFKFHNRFQVIFEENEYKHDFKLENYLNFMYTIVQDKFVNKKAYYNDK